MVEPFITFLHSQPVIPMPNGLRANSTLYLLDIEKEMMPARIWLHRPASIRMRQGSWDMKRVPRDNYSGFHTYANFQACNLTLTSSY